jgi:hypothetical protein
MIAAIDTAELTESKLEALSKLTKDLKSIVANLEHNEARLLVELYYDVQKTRTIAGNQVCAGTKRNTPTKVLEWVGDNAGFIEVQIRNALHHYSKQHPMGRWALQICGIGPVLSAALLSHFDITKAPTYGHYWSFAGLNPMMVWKKGEKRPFCARLKVTCWKISDSFVKQSGRKQCFYGHIYREAKARLVADNAQKKFAAAAEAVLAKKPQHAQADMYRQGLLPDSHVDMRARRFTVKLFVSHYWEAAYRNYYRTEPPVPYPIAHLNHAHIVTCPYPWEV